MSLYEKFLEMRKTAEETDKLAAVDEARVQVIAEAVEEAEKLIKEADIKEYTSDDIADVATALINNELEAEEEAEKVAELYDYGKIMMEGMIDRWKEEKLAEEVVAKPA